MRTSNNSLTGASPSDLPSELIDKEELRRRLNLPSVRMVEELMRKRKIPFVKLGHRTVRFSWPKVLAAITALEQRAIDAG
jgi:hypothetical protein